MGWQCRNCKNTESFTEINKVETLVTQEKSSTKIIDTINRYLEDPLISVRCNECNSLHVNWQDIKQDNSYIFNQKGYVSEDHKINTMVLELSTKCDLDCIYCPKESSNEMDIELIKRLLEENSKLKNPIKHFEFGWDMGNPLMHSKIKEIISIFNSFDCGVNILTNGKNLIPYLENLNLDHRYTITLFLDHPKKQENDKIMGKVYDKTLEAIKYLKKHNINHNVYMRLSSYNYDQIENMVKLVGNVVPTTIYPLGKATKKMLVTKKMKKQAIADIDRLNLNKSIHFSPFGDCTYNRKQRIFIDVNGNLSFCHFLQTSLIKADKSLLELIQINNHIRNKFLEKKANAKEPPCEYCMKILGV